MRKKSIFLVGAMMLILGGNTISLRNRVLASETGSVTSTSVTQECTHEKLKYIYAGLTHSIECEDCGKDLGSGTHIDENNDMRCDACLVKLSAVAPTTAEGYVSSKLTLDDSIKISIKANKDEVSGISISAWYGKSTFEKLETGVDEDGNTYSKGSIYTIKAEYNEETACYEANINFLSVDGKDGKYYFDALIFGKTGSQRYVRLSVVEYVKNGISSVTTYKNLDGTIDVSIKAVEGGEIYIAKDGEIPTDESEWVAYNSAQTYTVDDSTDSLKEISVYYRALTATGAVMKAPTVLRAPSTNNSSTMVTEWTTKNVNTEITLPVQGDGLNVTINWGDGATTQTSEAFPKHTYATAGVYDITITGTCPVFGYTEINTPSTTSEYYSFTQYLTGVKQFGELSATRYGFSKCSKLQYVSGDATENTFANVTNMSNMFYGCSILKSMDLSNFDTSNVTEFSSMFFNCRMLKEIDLKSFNTSKAERMGYMFLSCTFLENVDLSSFDTKNTKIFLGMFSGCKYLKTLNLKNFSFANATNISRMFEDCEKIQSIDFGNITLQQQCDANGMFKNCSKLKKIDLSFIDSANITNASRLLYKNTSLETIIVNSNFPADATDILTDTTNLKSIILTDSTPRVNQFSAVKDNIPNVIFYVPGETVETAYEIAWADDYSADRIKPILELTGDKEITIGTYEDYDTEDYLAMGIDVSNSGEYISLGYNVEHNSTVVTDTPGTYEHEYVLTRTVDGVKTTIMSIKKIVSVDRKAITAPDDFRASQHEDTRIITLTWKNHKNPNAKYEVSYKNAEGNWEILSADATTPHLHKGLSPNQTFEYRLRAYDDISYSNYTYTQGSTKPNIISGDTVLDTVKPIINFISYNPLDRYSRIGKNFEFLFSVTDNNYYSAYNKTSGDTVKIMIGGKQVPADAISVVKETITSGENVKVIVNRMPNIQASGEITLVIPANTIKDKALNGNIEMEYETPVIYVNSNITKNAPDVEIEYNKATITCNQTTDIEPDSVVIYYEYRKSGDSDFTRTDLNVIEDLEGNTYYEFRTVLIDITGNEVASDSVMKFIETVTPELTISVKTPVAGTYALGTELELEAKFTKPIKLVTNPIFVVKFGTGKNITLDGTYDEVNNLIKYTYTIQLTDLGKLTGVSFKGKVRALDGKLIEYNFVPDLEAFGIFARTGVRKINSSGDATYYPYIQDAINNVNDNKIEETIELYLSEEISTPIVVGENKKVFLYQNGKDIISNSGEYKAFINRGELKISEELGTGKIIVDAVDNGVGIENYGKLTIKTGYVQVKTSNASGSAIGISNEGTVILGENDGNVSEQTPIIDSTEFGIYVSNNGIFEFYDGVIMGARGKSYYGKITTCDGYNIVTENIETAREKTYIGVDRMPPKIDYEILTKGWRKDFVKVKITVYDEESGIKLVKLNTEELTMEADLTKEVQFDENGEYVVYAEDNVGNSSYKIIQINTIDKEAPNILSITADEDISDTEVKVLVTVRDYQSGLAGIIIKNVDEIPTDDENWILLDKYPTSKQIIPVAIKRGETNYCFAKDRAGNIGKYNGEIIVENIDKIAPVIQSAKIIKENGKDYIIGKAVLVDVVATDNVGVTDILITSQNMSDRDVKESEDWKEYTRYNVYKLPVEGDKLYTIYVWVKDAAGNISLHATASSELKALIIGDNEKDYVGSDVIYNKSRLRFRIKDWNYDFSAENALDKKDILLRITSGDKVIRNIQTGLTLKKIDDYISMDSNQYKGEIYELGMENIPGTGNLSLVILGGAVSDLARNAIQGVSKLTDIFIDNNAPKVKVENTELYDENQKLLRNITVKDNENNLIQAIEVFYKGVTKTYTLNNGKITLGLDDGEKIIAYDKAGNTLTHTVGSSVEPMLTADKYDVTLVYGGEAEKFGYVYNGDGAIYIESSDTTIANVSINTTTKEITVLPVNAGECEITVRTLGTKNYMDAKMKIHVTVKQRPVILEWSNGVFNYDGTEKSVTATVKNVILGDGVPIGEYRNSIRINSGKYTAEVLSVDNNNYTVEGGTNITFDWEIKKIDRIVTLDKETVSIRMPDIATINFTYTGEEAKGITTTISGEELIEPVVKEAHGEGTITLNPLTVGHSTTVILNIPESTNYNAASVSMNVRVTKLMTVFFDAQGGTPAFHTRTVEYDEPYGELPVSTNGVRTFIGWFTEKEGKGTLIQADTIVTIKDKHTLYACWNRAPENVKVSVKSKTTNSITLTMSAEDKDGDEITFDVYLDGKYKTTTAKITSGSSTEYTITGLSRYTYYSYYVIASDGMQETQSETGNVRTYCPGNDYTCTATYCDGYTHTIVTCSTCGGDGRVEEQCSGGSEITCSSCDGTGGYYASCPGPGSAVTCSACGGDGSNHCSDLPRMSGRTYAVGTCKNDSSVSVLRQDYICDTCGASGAYTACPHDSCVQYGTSNHTFCQVCAGSGYVPGDGAEDCSNCNGTGKNPCTGTVKEVNKDEIECPKCGKTATHTDYECDTCSITGWSEYCGSCNYQQANDDGNNDRHSLCPSCDGKGKIQSTTCPHGYSSSHIIDGHCSNCGGSGIVTQYCTHGYSSSHPYTTTCWRCDGDGDVDNATRPCPHGYSSSHYYCSHISNGSSSTHKYCSHGNVGQHD